MGLYTYDGETDVLYLLLVHEPEASIHRTVEVSDRVHVDLQPFIDRFDVSVEVPFTFDA